MKYILLILLSSGLMSGCGLNMSTQQQNNQEKEIAGKTSHQTKVKEANDPQIQQPAADTNTSFEKVETSGQVLPEYKMNEDYSIGSMKDSDEKWVLLTIDDAPAKNSLHMAKTLKDMGVNAIFFVNGHFIDTPEEGEVLKEIHELGFEIGNHTFSHKTLSELSESQQKEEIVHLNDRIEKLIGVRPKFFRAPFGINTEYSKQVAEDEKMLVMNWTYGYDWEKKYQTKDALVEIMINSPYLKNGANLLMHDRKWTDEALADIVKGLQKKGYKIVDPKLIETP